jgi:hypothetical protein
MGDDMTNQEVFDILEKYVDEHMDEILDILRKEYLSKLTKVEDILIGKAVYDFPTPIFIDNNEHMWYNTFNKWSWSKCENGVIKIDKRRV